MKTNPNLFSHEDFESLRTFVRREILPLSQDRDEKETFPADTYQKLHALGWINCIVPTALGGMGATALDMAHVFREIAYGSGSVSFTLGANATAALAILLYAKKEIAEEFAKDYLTRQSLSSFCFTEPDHGSDVLRIETFAKKVEGGYRITGKKCFITSANHADRHLVVAKIENGQSPKNAMSLFLVDAGTPGLTVGTDYQKLGMRESSTSEIFLDNVFVPDNRLVGNEGQGFQIAGRSIQRSRLMLASVAIGICDRIRDLTVDHLRNRILYEKPLLAQPTITNLLGQLHAEKEAAWGMIKAGTEAWEQGDPSFAPSSMAKLLSGQVATKYSSAGVELFGGYGYMKEYEIERLYRDAKFFEIVEGPNFVQLAILAKELFPVSSTSREKKAA